MGFFINDTTRYHETAIDTLGWELTVPNALEQPGTVIRKILGRETTFGSLLADYLSGTIPLQSIKNVVEIGGGYGFVMRDLLSLYKNLSATMVDISPLLLKKQRETLADFPVNFIEKDFFFMDSGLLKDCDFIMMNEITGDFPTACFIPHPEKETGTGDSPDLAGLYSVIEKYRLPFSGNGNYSLNIGAVRALEKIGEAGIPFVYVSEHSSEAILPDFYHDRVDPDGNPERIRLMGHDEYTIRFSDLVTVGLHYGYQVTRGRYADFIEIPDMDRLRYILSTDTCSDDHEIIRHFVYDLYKYEYLVLKKEIR